MLAGIILIISGLLIAIYPPLLALIIASLLILSGVMTLMVSYQLKKSPRSTHNSIIRVFF